MKKVALHTLGCKVNYAETSTIARQFAEHGFQVVSGDQPCDVYVLNTCSVTERADRECRQIIRRALRHSPNTYVIVTGCYAQLQPQEITSIEGVDLILGTKEKFNIFEHANGFVKQEIPQTFVSCIDEAEEFEFAYSGDIDGRTRAFLKIQDGCDYVCTFCTIPLARGQSRSRPVEEIVEQARQLVSRGYKEIVLTGVNVGDYGRKIGTDLFSLMQRLENVEGLERIRISSIEPNLLSEKMIDFILASEKFCNHFHLPLQSGSDTILKLMRRRYLSGKYRQLVEYIKQNDPDAALGCDVLVGFPGETNELFEETYQFLAELPVSYLHVFTYSERDHTPATSFSGRVEPRLRAERSERLRMLSKKMRHAFYSAFIGRTLNVLFEHPTSEGMYSGLTSNYIRVEVPTMKNLSNEILDVQLREMAENVCRGIIVETEVQHRSSVAKTKMEQQ
jgi:threonylcarbamoyladenosine tRNA methylthiotransferase MtaB